MRFRLRRNKVTRMRELVLKPPRTTALNMAQVRWLEGMREGPLLPLSYEASRNGTARALAYDVEGYMSLRRFVKVQSMSSEMLLGMVEELERAVSLCVSAGHPYLSVLFDERYVFVGTSARLHFAFLPLNGLQLGSANSPLSVLGCLGNARRLQLDSPNAIELCDRLARFVLGEQGIFSPNDLRDFLCATREGDCANGEVVDFAAHADARPGERLRVRGACLSNVSFVLRPLRHDLTWPLATNRSETVGRGRGCTVSLSGMPRISRRHASVCAGERRIVLMDLGSTNGTFVDGHRLVPSKACEIKPGQIFMLADEPFCVDRNVRK